MSTARKFGQWNSAGLPRSPGVGGSPDKAILVNTMRSGVRRVIREPKKVLKEICDEYMENSIREALMKYASKETKKRGFEMLQDILRNRLRPGTGSVRTFCSLVFLNSDSAIPRSEIAAREKKKLALTNDKFGEELAALDELCAQKELLMKEKKGYSLLYLFPELCSRFDLTIELGPAFFQRLVSMGLLQEPDSPLVARLLTESYVLLNDISDYQLNIEQPWQKGAFGNSNDSNGNGIIQTNQIQIQNHINDIKNPNYHPWNLELYHHFLHPVFSGLQGKVPGSPKRNLRSTKGNRTLSPDQKCIDLGSSQRLPGRNRSSSREKNHPQVTAGQQKTKILNSSLIIIAITREVLLQHQELLVLQEEEEEQLRAQFNNNKNYKPPKEQIIQDGGYWNEFGEWIDDTGIYDEDQVPETYDKLETQQIRELLMEHSCCIFDNLRNLGNSPVAMLGLLHCVAQFQEHRLWPYEYTLEIATFCLEVLRKKPQQFGRDLVLVSVLCLGFVAVGLLEGLGGQVLGKGNRKSSETGENQNDDNNQQLVAGNAANGRNGFSLEEIVERNHGHSPNDDHTCVKNNIAGPFPPYPPYPMLDENGQWQNRMWKEGQKLPQEGWGNGYYDEFGNWVQLESGQNHQNGGYYDEYGNWIEKSDDDQYYDGYYDEHGNWIDIPPDPWTVRERLKKQRMQIAEQRLQERIKSDQETLTQFCPIIKKLTTHDGNPDLFRLMRGDRHGTLRKSVDFCFESWFALENFLKDLEREALQDRMEQDELVCPEGHVRQNYEFDRNPKLDQGYSKMNMMKELAESASQTNLNLNEQLNNNLENVNQIQQDLDYEDQIGIERGLQTKTLQQQQQIPTAPRLSPLHDSPRSLRDEGRSFADAGGMEMIIKGIEKTYPNALTKNNNSTLGQSLQSQQQYDMTFGPQYQQQYQKGGSSGSNFKGSNNSTMAKGTGSKKGTGKNINNIKGKNNNLNNITNQDSSGDVNQQADDTDTRTLALDTRMQSVVKHMTSSKAYGGGMSSEFTGASPEKTNEFAKTTRGGQAWSFDMTANFGPGGDGSYQSYASAPGVKGGSKGRKNQQQQYSSPSKGNNSQSPSPSSYQRMMGRANRHGHTDLMRNDKQAIHDLNQDTYNNSIDQHNMHMNIGTNNSNNTNILNQQQNQNQNNYNQSTSRPGSPHQVQQQQPGSQHGSRAGSRAGSLSRPGSPGGQSQHSRGGSSNRSAGSDREASGRKVERLKDRNDRMIEVNSRGRMEPYQHQQPQILNLDSREFDYQNLDNDVDLDQQNQNLQYYDSAKRLQDTIRRKVEENHDYSAAFQLCITHGDEDLLFKTLSLIEKDDEIQRKYNNYRNPHAGLIDASPSANWTGGSLYHNSSNFHHHHPDLGYTPLNKEQVQLLLKMLIKVVGRESEHLLNWWMKTNTKNNNMNNASGAISVTNLSDPPYLSGSHWSSHTLDEENDFVRARLNYLGSALETAEQFCSLLKVCVNFIGRYAGHLGIADCETLRHHCLRLSEIRTLDGAVQKLARSLYNTVTPMI